MEIVDTADDKGEVSAHHIEPFFHYHPSVGVSSQTFHVFLARNLKAVPGASEEAMAQAGRYADRLSANIELPTQADLSLLAPEKKRAEILQLAALEPEFAVLDETDSGLDIDALKVVARGVNTLRAADRGVLLITHYQRLLDHIVPDSVHVLYKGQVIKSGDKTLAHELEANGYADIIEAAA